MREPKRLSRVTQNEISLDVGGIVYWKTERLKKAEKTLQESWCLSPGVVCSIASSP